MTIKVRVDRVGKETPEICSLALTPLEGACPEFTPGAHVDVHLPGGFIRQYSLLNGPADRDAVLIGVKREPNGRGGSAAVHELSVGDVLEICAPRNNFELADEGGPAILLAGGIGITPLLSMARHLQAQGKPHTLHLFARDAIHAPFLDQLAKLDNAPVHLGLSPPTLDKVLAGILSDPPEEANLYLCGPGPLMDLVERQAAIAGWPQARVHLERFSADLESLDTSGAGFEVILKQSGQSLFVEDGVTIIEAMENAGLAPLTSCEQGVCGTCMTNVIEGVPDHRDGYLTPTEKESGKVMMICVSRCKSNRLVLDL